MVRILKNPLIGNASPSKTFLIRNKTEMHVKLTQAAERVSELGQTGWFTGAVWLDEIAVGEPPSTLRVHSVTFSPGARTAWHMHPLGQILHVMSGMGRVQVDGEPVREIGPGDHVSIAAGERHWHGAAPNRVFVHLAIQETARDGKEADWFEHVSDENYFGETKC
jgi:quercetin dioxygenase-like cupin family protein